MQSTTSGERSGGTGSTAISISNMGSANSTRPTASLTELSVTAAWMDFEPQIRRTISTFGPLLAQGFSGREIARLFGLSEEAVARRVQELRTALVEHGLAGDGLLTQRRSASAAR